MAEHFPQLRLNAETENLLATAWTKPAEDRIDALFCALIGYHHWLHRGNCSEVLGDINTGFILLPRDLDSNTAAPDAENPA